jgi:hypothetical protein
LYGGNYRGKTKKDDPRGADYKSPMKRIYVKRETVKRQGKTERHGIVDVDKERRRYPIDTGKKIIRFPDLVDKTKKKKVRNYPEHICHGFFYVYDNKAGGNGVDAIAEKDVVQHRGFDHPVIEKSVAERTGSRGVVKPRTGNKVDDSGDYPETDNIVVKHRAFPKIPGKDKKYQNIAHIKGKPRLERNVIEAQQFPHGKEKHNHRMNKDDRFLLPFRFKKIREY